MSWSIGYKGTKEETKKNLALQAESPLGAYAGKPEADDITAALDRALKLVDAIDFAGTEYDGVNVTAYGSHSSTSTGIVSGSFSVSVSAVKLEAAGG
jgi:hypothetical protein